MKKNQKNQKKIKKNLIFIKLGPKGLKSDVFFEILSFLAFGGIFFTYY